MNEAELNYFSKIWNPQWRDKKLSGWALLDKFKPEDKILDIGCGKNFIKGKLGDQVYGIDPAFEEADEVISLEDFVPKDKYNVFVCLGSINFGTAEEIEAQLQKITDMAQTGARIYWRQNSYGNDHSSPEASVVRFFPWSIDINKKYCEKYGYTLHDIQVEPENANRLYAEWIKN